MYYNSDMIVSFYIIYILGDKFIYISLFVSGLLGKV